MTAQPGELTPSDFDARADNAALALRKGLQGQGREVDDSSPVVVDKDGRPPAPPPPEGSYARQALELQQRQQQERANPQDEPGPAQRPDQPAEPAPQEPAAEKSSPRAEQRIQELVGQLRQRDQELQQALENGKKATETANQFSERLQALETQHQQMLQANLENLDPETRMQVLQDARLTQRFDEFKGQILNEIKPQLRTLEEQASHNEMQALSTKYPKFNPEVHGSLIDMFRGRNPNCSIEQAFRAVAEPEELVTQSSPRAQAVPPTLPPGSGELAAARFTPPMARPAPPEPEDELVEESRRIAELRRSTDPAEQKQGMQMLDQHLKRRLGG